MKNERGQATIAALILLPLVLAIVMSLGILAYALSLEAKATAACRASLIESQKEAAHALEELLSLNKWAGPTETTVKALRIARDVARATKLPPAVAIAEGAYATAYTAQTLLKMRQKFWLIRGQITSQMAPFKAAAAVRQALPDGLIGRAFKNLFHDPLSFSRDAIRAAPTYRRAKFHMIASPPGARTPTYRTAPGFARSQRASAHWLLTIQVPGFDFKPRIELGCAATLENGTTGGDDWFPQITEDKLLLN